MRAYQDLTRPRRSAVTGSLLLYKVQWYLNIRHLHRDHFVNSLIVQQGDIEVIEFVEAYMEVLTALGDAENDLYSANFAEYAGGGGMKARQTK